VGAYINPLPGNNITMRINQQQRLQELQFLSDVGVMLTRTRRMSGIKESTVAARIGAPTMRYKRYEAGEEWPSLLLMYRLQEVLGRPMSYFFNEEAQTPDSASETMHDIIRLLAHMTPGQVQDWLLDGHKKISNEA
jgi:transcriptional regulator with XRE-family HTH domain